jgi:hypothetical protein
VHPCHCFTVRYYCLSACQGSTTACSSLPVSYYSSGRPMCDVHLLQYRILLTVPSCTLLHSSLPVRHCCIIFTAMYCIHYWCTPASQGLTVYNIFTAGVPLLHYTVLFTTLHSLQVSHCCIIQSYSLLYIHCWCPTAALYRPIHYSAWTFTDGVPLVHYRVLFITIYSLPVYFGIIRSYQYNKFTECVPPLDCQCGYCVFTGGESGVMWFTCRGELAPQKRRMKGILTMMSCRLCSNIISSDRVKLIHYYPHKLMFPVAQVLVAQFVVFQYLKFRRYIPTNLPLNLFVDLFIYINIYLCTQF